MKKIISFTALALALALSVPNASAQVTGLASRSAEGYLGVKDTLTNADTTTYEVTITGAKHIISFQCNVLKLTGTVAGKFDVYGSVDGVNYETALAATSVTKANSDGNYVISFTSNKYKKYKVMSISSGTNTHSQRVYALWRELK